MTDPALLSSMLYSSEQFMTRMRCQKERLFALSHLEETIRILTKRIQEPVQEISDTTLAAVAGLALTEVPAPTFWLEIY
jgi:hypothetical protein